MLKFWGWLIEGERPRCVRQGVHGVSRLNTLACPMRGGCWSFREWLNLLYPFPLFEARGSSRDVGLRAFIASQDRSLKEFLAKLLATKKITDPLLVQEARALIAGQADFSYGAELLRIASAGRARLAGGDALQGATEAAGRMWELLWRPESYAGTQTWETRFPLSALRGGIRGTVRAVANHLIGHFAQRLRKSRASGSTVQQSQLDKPIEPEGRASNEEGEWQEWKEAILRELVKDLNRELASKRGGKHWDARVRNLRWAIAIADAQMRYPYELLSVREVMATIPGLRGVPRGGLQQVLTNLIDSARMRVIKRLGTEKEQAIAYGLQRRSHRSLGQTEGRFLPSPRECRAAGVEG
jgi:hypothetical protein